MTVKYRCDDCDELVQIVSTGKKQKDGFSAEWQQIVTHWSKKTGQPCPGSGRLV